jgi:Cu(I)/Ag(I) efflux system membrane fusion protein
LLVPSEALIRTGKRTLVMLALGKGHYRPAEVRIGRESDDETEIIAGLDEGEKIVASGQFLIDSEASLSGVKARPVDAAGSGR